MFNIKDIPFSAYDSFFTLSYLKGAKGYDEGLYIRLVKGGDNNISHLFKLEFLEEYKVNFTPQCISFMGSKGEVEVVIAASKVMRIKGKNMAVKLKYQVREYDHILDLHKYWEINSYSEEIRIAITTLEGTIKVDAPWKNIKNSYIDIETSKDFDIALEEYKVVPEFNEGYEKFYKYYNYRQNQFNIWLDKTLPGCKGYKEGRELAAYITWSSVVPRGGNLPFQAMYMSKNWMTNIWSWDNCFNALALLHNDCDLALDQLRIFFSKQHSTGMLPDFVNDKYSYYNSTKPPIHGWTIITMMEEKPEIFTKDIVEELYYPLVKWTEWWFKYRDLDKDGIPEYFHGNDSGWDNSTLFSKGTPVESPDICAFLALQLEALEIMAKIIGEDYKIWHNKKNNMINLLIRDLWKENKFIGREYYSHDIIENNSLILYIPLILGKRLPDYVRDSLIEQLKKQGQFYTSMGLATEKITSDLYEEDGYWRGPIWAPSTFILFKGLQECGEEELAYEMAEKFCNMAERNGMAENYHATTGEGLRDKSFTWTSSVFLMLNNYLKNKKLDNLIQKY